MGFFRDLKDNLNETSSDFDKSGAENNADSRMIHTLDDDYAKDSSAQPELARLAASLAKEAELSFDKEYSHRFHSNDNTKSDKSNDTAIDDFSMENGYVDTLSTDDLFMYNESMERVFDEHSSVDKISGNQISEDRDKMFTSRTSRNRMSGNHVSNDSEFVNTITDEKMPIDRTLSNEVFDKNILNHDESAEYISTDDNVFTDNASGMNASSEEPKFTQSFSFFNKDEDLENNSITPKDVVPPDSTASNTVKKSNTIKKTNNTAASNDVVKSNDSTMPQENVSVIAKDLFIEGELNSKGSIELYGSVIGNVTCMGKLTISGTLSGDVKTKEMFAENARIQGNIESSGSIKIGHETIIVGNIFATSAVIAGAVKGDIDVHGPVIIDSTAIILGNIKSESVQVNNGATIQGCYSQCYADFKSMDIFDDFIEEINKKK